MSAARTKVVRLGRTAAGDLFAKIELTPRDQMREGLRLSITGVEGPKANGDARGSCGQVVMSRPALLVYAPGWDAATVERFWQTWDAWHLNDMRAGCQHQRAMWQPEAELEIVKGETKRAGWVYPTEHPGGLLTKPCEVCGYKYGSSWLFEPVPEDVVSFLFSLPDADRAPAWI